MATMFKLSIIQLMFSVIFSIFVGLLWGFSYGKSALLGGLICSVANVFFSGKLFFYKSKDQTKQTLRHFYRSESSKIALTVAMFILVFLLIDIEFLPFIVAYSLATLLNLLCLPILNS